MGVYQIKAHENTYDIIDLDVVVLAEKLAETPTLDEDTLIELLMNLPFDNTSLKSMWPDEMVCSYFGKSK